MTSDRYHRQRLLPEVGEEGQRRLAAARVLVAGCGALGSVMIDALARCGVGALILVDRDVVEWTNLQRQLLYAERHAREGVPKAVAAAERVREVNADVEVQAHVEDLSAANAVRLAQGADLILDGLDNFETRYLLNDLAVSEGLPLVYGGAIGTSGMMMSILPGGGRRRGTGGRVRWNEEQATPCLRCVFPEAPPPGASPTCDTAGVLGPAVTTVASLQATQAIKLLLGDVVAIERRLVSIDFWRNEWRFLDVSHAGPSPECPCCGQGRFEHLDGAVGGGAVSLCGRSAVQVVPAGAEPGRLALEPLAARLSAHGQFTLTPYMLRGALAHERGLDGPIELTLFPDGRAILKGTTDTERARSLYAKYVGA